MSGVDKVASEETLADPGARNTMPSISGFSRKEVLCSSEQHAFTGTWNETVIEVTLAKTHKGFLD